MIFLILFTWLLIAGLGWFTAWLIGNVLDGLAMNVTELKTSLDEIADQLTEIHDALSGKVDPGITGELDTIVSQLEQINGALPSGPPPVPPVPTVKPK